MSNILVNNTLADATDTPPHESLLGFLRQTARLTGTKEGCASGDCGACTVILRNADGSNPININSCITPVGAALDRQVITVEGVGTPLQMHPVQQAMVDKHASQCGFCTPGFVMSLVAAQLRRPTGAADGDRHAAIEAVSGNLCRCTGYRPIIDAAVAANRAIAGGAAAPLPAPRSTPPQAMDTHGNRGTTPDPQSPTYVRPHRLASLLKILERDGLTRSLADQPLHGSSRWLVAGATDAFLEVSQRYLDPVLIADLSAVVELQGIDDHAGEIRLGAAVTHAAALEYFAQPATHCAAIVAVLKRFGSPQIRARGTLGGNIANASPIADWPPLLLALGAELTLINTNNEQRRLPLADFYVGYKSTRLADNELLVSVHIPAGAKLQNLRAHKISKRFEDDISSVLGAVYLQIDNAEVSQCRIACGGVAATPLRCFSTENVLRGKPLTAQLVEEAVAQLGEEIKPISDVRASSNYRKAASQAVLRNVLIDKLNSMTVARS